MVYFLKDENNLIKIGFSKNVINRIKHLMSQTPYECDVILILNENFKYEQELHKKFAKYKKAGEWFSFSDEIMDYIINNLHKDTSWALGFGKTEFKHGVKLKNERIRQGLTLQDLADKLNITPQSLQRFEIGELHGTISFKTFLRVSTALGKKFEYRLV